MAAASALDRFQGRAFDTAIALEGCAGRLPRASTTD
jgi:hypothetical protein